MTSTRSRRVRRRGGRPVQVRICTAAGCLSSGADAVRQGLDSAVTEAGLQIASRSAQWVVCVFAAPGRWSGSIPRAYSMSRCRRSMVRRLSGQ